MSRSHLSLILLACIAILIGGCKPEPEPDVVLYTAVDEPVARPIIERFQRQTGLKVLLKTDTEATKTAGLAARLEAEKNNPQADVWWGNEVFHTINLADRGVLAAYASPAAANIPAQYKDAQGRWAGTALRARVVARTTASRAPLPSLREINSIMDLTDPQLSGRICMARPTAGTTGGHVAALYTLWGPERAESFFRELKANDIKLLGGNSVVADYVGQGQMWAGLTDNDDIEAAQRQGGSIELVLPDQGPDQIGTLTIPCTVGLVAGAKRADAARRLIDYLLSPEVEQALLQARFARYSVFAGPDQERVKPMDVDYRQVARNLRPAVEMAMRVLEGRE